ncbi:hypothetical protein [Agarilytica rhodophyticola]|uniref:hypothetical protein n=1 Tax=Agarilytica rhodophyticola TaxID=1737490 RepID=UPI001315809F|nr:hypothetical protein [Agarilytica rhodophyticola]
MRVNDARRENAASPWQLLLHCPNTPHPCGYSGLHLKALLGVAYRSFRMTKLRSSRLA